MRILKLLIAVVFSIAMFSTISAGAQPLADAGLIPSRANPASSISEIAAGNLEASAASPAFATLPDSSASAAVSVSEPTPAALHLTPAIPDGVAFTPTVTLPTPGVVPEPGTILLATAASLLLLRRPRHLTL